MPAKNSLHPDTALFSRIARGEEDAFTEIFYKYTAQLYPFVLKLIHAELWAEEIVQDVFLRLWQNRENLTAIENPSAYIYQMAANRTLDYIKRNAKEVKVQYWLGRQQAARKNDLTEEELDYREADTLLKEAIAKLPDQRRRVYLLAREQGLSQEQIAAQLGISKHTVRNHVAEALAEIRHYLTDHGAFTTLAFLALKNIL